jgi:ribosomal protein L35
MSASKTFSKRIRITKNGKIVRRPMGTDHFKTRHSTKTNRNTGKSRGLDYPIKKLSNYGG